MWLQRRRRRAGGAEQEAVWVSCRKFKEGAAHSFLPRDSAGPTLARSVTGVRVKAAEEQGSARGNQSQSRRLKITYKLAQTIPIRSIAKGYPRLQSSSGISKSTADRILDHLAPLLAISPARRPRRDTVYIVDGTLVPTRDRSVAASSKNYRYSTNLQVVIDANSLLVVAIGLPLPGNRNDCRAFTESGVDQACRGAPVIADGGYQGTDLLIPYRRRRGHRYLSPSRRQRTPSIAGLGPGSNTPCPG